jgi:SPX domain protein involved in polyphosphate accumulation
MEQRLEKKFVFLPGDSRKIELLKIEGFFRKIYNKRKVNSIYYDTLDLNCLWDNINGFSNRDKYRVRWYDDINNSEFFFEKKKKLIKQHKKLKLV